MLVCPILCVRLLDTYTAVAYDFAKLTATSNSLMVVTHDSCLMTGKTTVSATCCNAGSS